MSRSAIVNTALLILLIGGGLVSHATGQIYWVTLATKAAIFALAGVGLNLVLGYGGLVSFGHAAFFGIGGYVTAIMASHAMGGTPVLAGIEGTKQMLILWPLSMIAAALVAIPIGVLSLRTSGAYFIMVTLAFAQMIYWFAIGWPAYGGEDGLSFYVRNNLPGLNTMDNLTWFLTCAALLGAALAMTAVMMRARFGLALKSARRNPARTVAVGIRPFGIRLTAFVISAAIVGLAGSLYADLNRFVSPTMLSWHMSGEIMVFVILGGVGRLMGPLAGAMVFVIMEHIFGGMSDYWQALLGAALLLIVLFAPGGIVGLLNGKGGQP